MVETSARIRPLPHATRAKIASSCEIVSPDNVIEGLVQNALDADANSITIEAELAKGYYSVRDDGTGIKEIEFADDGHLAKLHCTNTL